MKKILIEVGIAILCGFLLCGCAEQKHTQFDMTDQSTPTVGKLWTEYRYINTLAFYGGLPEKLTTIKLVNLDGKEMAEISETNESYDIRIDPADHPVEKEAEITLIHEMCHQDDHIKKLDEGIGGHGENFQRCMQHIAEVGGFADLW